METTLAELFEQVVDKVKRQQNAAGGGKVSYDSETEQETKENEPSCLKCSQNTVLTNRQWLETLTDEEFAVWLESFNSCNRCMRQGNDCFPYFDIEDWLKREHRED